MNRLYYGDNLQVLRRDIADESVDLVYLDPPFNSNRGYNVIFARHDVKSPAEAQIQAFDDTWKWTPVTDAQYGEYINGGLPLQVSDALTAFRVLLGENDAMAYLVNMAPRLVELHRVLKPTGSLYLHCDPTMSHYLKILLDAIFGAERFRSEISWKRYGSHNDAKNFGAVHDVILYYTKTKTFTFNKQFTEYDPAYIAERYRNIDADGRRWMEQNLSSPNPRPNLTYPYTASNGVTYTPPPNGWKVTPDLMAQLDREGRLHYPKKEGGRLRLKMFLDEAQGVPVQDVWTDITTLGGTNPERLGYPTQKPVALLERILLTSSNPGDVVLDPFCGCGTTVDAAQKLDRQWVGIDVTYLAIDLIEKRLEGTYGSSVKGTYSTAGIPKDKAAALALFSRDPFEFERWAVALLNAQPHQRSKQQGDKGIDGVARFPLDAKRKGDYGQILVSVKGGQSLNPSMVRDLGGTVTTRKADMGVLITNGEPTRGMTEEANHAGTYTYPVNGQVYPRIQIITVADLLGGKRPNLPATVNPYMQATKSAPTHEQPDMFSDLGE